MRIPLSGGAYTARNVSAAAQRCLNLYAEPVPPVQGEPSQWSYYPAAGLSAPLVTLPTGPLRGLYRATNDKLYAVGGDTVYAVSSGWTATALGTITPALSTPVSMSDNGLDLIVVDGTPGGWDVTLSSNAFAPLTDPTGAFAGADRVDYLDTYFLFNKPGTPQFYASLSLSNTFDPLYFADKESHSDNLITLAVARREIWLLGATTSEIWYNAGATDFPFAEMQSVFIDHGCIARYSVATSDNTVFWLSRDRAGTCIVMAGAGYTNNRVSTYAIEYEMTTYPTVSDAVGMVYQYAGHRFYHLTFPSAHGNRGATWLYDMTTQQWSELCWIDSNGTEYRHRANCAAQCYDQVIVGDWESGNIYRLDTNVYTDFGGPIKRVRCFPHLTNESKRLFYKSLSAEMDTGVNPAAAPVTTTTTALNFQSGQYLALTPAQPSIFGSLNAQADALNWGGGVGYLQGQSPDGIAVFNIATMTVTREITSASMLTGGDVAFSPLCTMITGADAALYLCTVAALVRVDPTSLRQTAAFPAGFGVGWGPAGFTEPGLLASLPGVLFVVGAGTTADWGVLAIPAMTYVASGTLSGAARGMVTGAGSAWAVCSAGSVAVAVDQISPTGAHSSTTIPLSAIEPGATSVLTLANPMLAWDGIDNTLIVYVETSPDGGTTIWPDLVKWSPTRGVLWVCRLGGQLLASAADGQTVTGATVALFLRGEAIEVDLAIGTLLSNRSASASVPAFWPIAAAAVQAFDATEETALGWFNMTSGGNWARTVPTSTSHTVTVPLTNQILLDWSDTRGHNWSDPIADAFGAYGAYQTNLLWRRLGFGRSRVFRLSWSAPIPTVLLGASIDVTPGAS